MNVQFKETAHTYEPRLLSSNRHVEPQKNWSVELKIVSRRRHLRSGRPMLLSQSRRLYLHRHRRSGRRSLRDDYLAAVRIVPGIPDLN